MSDDSEAILRSLRFSAGHRAMSMEDIVRIQPGLGRLMPEIGARTWKLYYAARAGNWQLAAFQYKEVKGLLDLCAFTRPKHEEGLKRYLTRNWASLEEPIRRQDFAVFEGAFHKAVRAANGYHALADKPYIVWKLPDEPPPDLDLSPIAAGKKPRPEDLDP